MLKKGGNGGSRFFVGEIIKDFESISTCKYVCAYLFQNILDGRKIKYNRVNLKLIIIVCLPFIFLICLMLLMQMKKN